MSERKEVIVGGTLYYADMIAGQAVLVQVIDEVIDPFDRTSTDHIRGKGARRRYHRSGNAPVFRPGRRFE
jgi:hypothetical protein